MRQERVVISVAGDTLLFNHSVILTHVNGWMDMTHNTSVAPIISVYDTDSIENKPSDPAWTFYPEHSKNTEQGVYFDIGFNGDGGILLLKGLLVEIGSMTNSTGEMFLSIR